MEKVHLIFNYRQPLPNKYSVLNLPVTFTHAKGVWWKSSLTPGLLTASCQAISWLVTIAMTGTWQGKAQAAVARSRTWQELTLWDHCRKRLKSFGWALWHGGVLSSSWVWYGLGSLGANVVDNPDQVTIPRWNHCWFGGPLCRMTCRAVMVGQPNKWKHNLSSINWRVWICIFSGLSNGVWVEWTSSILNESVHTGARPNLNVC